MTEPAPSPSVRPLSLMSRVIGVITSPRATFENIIAAPRPVGVLFLVALVVSLAAGLPQFTDAGRQAALDMQVRQIERFTGQPVSPQMYEQMEARGQYSAYFGIIGAFITLPVFSLLLAAVFWAVFNAAMGGTASFKQVLAVVTHSQVIGALGAVVGAPIQLMQGTVSMGGPFNLGALAPMLDEGSTLATILGSISVFTIWGVIVSAIGLSVLYHRKTRNIAIALLAFYILITAAIALVFSRFAGGS